MSVSLDRGTTIGRLRLLAATADPNALRMRGGLVLGTLDLQPPAMPEQAILCIRALRDPLPGGLDLRSSAAPRPVAWETAMRSAVGEALGRAVRPALGPVPASADAVLFADRAELLACAARDAPRGALAIDWWWTHLLGGERSVAAVMREWARSPAYVPAAVELLAARSEIVAFARAVAPAEAVRMIEAVLRAHALPAVAFEIVNALTASFAPLPSTTVPPVTEPRCSSPAEARPRAELLAPPPWRAVVGDLAPAALTLEQQSFVAIALALRRAPALVRSGRFAGEAAAWIENERRGERRRDGSVASRPAAPPHAARAHEERGEPDEAPTAEPERQLPEPRHLDRHHQPAERRDITAAAQRTEEPTPVEGRRDSAPATASPEPRPTRSPSVDELPPPDAAPTPEIIARSADYGATEPPQPIDVDLAVDSDFAGVFFLLNVAIALGLYSDFTSPVQCGIPLDVWDFLALAGGALAGIAGLEDDPIGPFLAALANRQEGEPPGAGFVPPEGRSLSEWLDAIVGRIRERLALAGIDNPSRVVRRYGRVTTTPAHLDIYFSLAAHPIEIRRAGLDRNPGWIPAAGRHVAFHFD